MSIAKSLRKEMHRINRYILCKAVFIYNSSLSAAKKKKGKKK